MMTKIMLSQHDGDEWVMMILVALISWKIIRVDLLIYLYAYVILFHFIVTSLHFYNVTSKSSTNIKLVVIATMQINDTSPKSRRGNADTLCIK